MRFSEARKVSALWGQRLPDRAWILSAQAEGQAAGILRPDQKMVVQSLQENNIDAARFSIIVPAISAAGDPMGAGSPV